MFRIKLTSFGIAKLLSIGLITSAAISWILGGYYNYDIHTLLTFIPHDPPGNVDITDKKLVVHTFGDYLLPNAWINSSDPWINDVAPWNIYPPLAMCIFWIFNLFPYKLGVILFLILNFATMTFPILYELFLAKKPEKWLLLLPTCLSVGLITTLDRGNIVGLVVLPIYLFVKNLNDNKFKKAAFYLAVAVSIKVYPIILILLFLRIKKYKMFFFTLGYTLIISVCSSLFWLQTFIENFKNIISRTLTYGQGTDVALDPYNASAIAGIKQALQVFNSVFDSELNLVTPPALVSLFIGTMFLVLVLCDRIPFIYILYAGISAMWLIPSLSYHYVLCFAIIPLAILISVETKSQGVGTEISEPRFLDVPKIVQLLLYASIFFTMTPIILLLPGFSQNLRLIFQGISWILVLLILTGISLFREFKSMRKNQRMEQ
jgi:hypothetical protein